MKHNKKAIVMLMRLCSASQQLNKVEALNKNSFRVTHCAAFTLIELLVVVLIIGILSAIALPQYQRAVEKARLTEVLTNNKAMENAMDLYVLENGYPENSIYVYDLVELSGGNSDNAGSYFTQHVQYSGHCQQNACSLEHYQHPENRYALQSIKTSSSTDWTRTCITEETDMGRYICKSLESLGWEYSDSEM